MPIGHMFFYDYIYDVMLFFYLSIDNVNSLSNL